MISILVCELSYDTGLKKGDILLRYDSQGVMPALPAEKICSWWNLFMDRNGEKGVCQVSSWTLDTMECANLLKQLSHIWCSSYNWICYSSQPCNNPLSFFRTHLSFAQAKIGLLKGDVVGITSPTPLKSSVVALFSTILPEMRCYFLAYYFFKQGEC